MYLRITQRHNRDGSTVSYYALAESVWNADAKRREARVVHSFGRADQLDRAELERLVKSINRVLDDGGEAAGSTGTADRPEIEIERVFELGVVLAARALWEDLGIGPAIRRCAEQAGLTAPHETALFAMAANRLDDPVSKLACAERWLPDIAWLPDGAGLAVDQCYRALDFLAVWADEIEREVFLKTADLFRLDVDLIFYDTTTAYFEIDEPDEDEQEFAGRLYAPLRKRGHNKEGRDNQPQVIIALAVTRDGMPGARGYCPATPPTWRRSRASSRTCMPGGSAAACSSAMPGCTRPTTWLNSAADWVVTSWPYRCAGCAISRKRC
jgi:hypothetical protein